MVKDRDGDDRRAGYPIPPYYLDRDEKRHRTTLRKTHRRGDNSIGCFIYPYKEEANGGWDYNVESLFIYECDFTILAAGIKACYPLNNGERAFDYTSWNEFTVAECERIISSGWMQGKKMRATRHSFNTWLNGCSPLCGNMTRL